MTKLDWQVDWPEPLTWLWPLLLRAADSALEAGGIKAPCGVSLRITGDDEIKAINRDYRGIDQATDVLSFPMIGYPKGVTLGNALELLGGVYDDALDGFMLGDIVISMDHLKWQAQQYGSGLEREAAYLLVHGMCHLMGYDHMDEQDQIKMRKIEEKAMSSMGLSQEKTNGIDKEKLMALARQAMEQSYSPYSKFRVGAALLCADGRVYQGCNVENASYGASNCAERTAVFKAVSEGARDFEAIAVAADATVPWPCGICRQVLNEFAPDIKLYLTWGEGETLETTLKAILPHGFGPEDVVKIK